MVGGGWGWALRDGSVTVVMWVCGGVHSVLWCFLCFLCSGGGHWIDWISAFMRVRGVNTPPFAPEREIACLGEARFIPIYLLLHVGDVYTLIHLYI